jgi:hypothetical protein
MSQHTPKSKLYYRNREVVKQRDSVCALCGAWIDPTLNYLPYTEKSQRKMHPMSFSLDHILSVVGRPDLAEDIDNMQASHLVCNQRKGRGKKLPPLPETPYVIDDF